jgi:hypothetical protein
MILKLLFVLGSLGALSQLKADPAHLSPEQWVGFAKLAVDSTVSKHGSAARFRVISYEIGRLSRAGKAFDGTAVNFTVGEEISYGLDVYQLPVPLTFDWVTTTGTAGDFTQQELLSASKITIDQFVDEVGCNSVKKITSYRVFFSQSEYPVRIRLNWQEVVPKSDEVKTGEFEYFCHKPGTRFECHRVN